jgi:hypothetical protein
MSTTFVKNSSSTTEGTSAKDNALEVAALELAGISISPA